MAVLLILFSIRMKLLSFDIVNFGFPQSLENMFYDFMSFKLFSSGYKHVSSTYWAISPHARMGGGGDCSIDPILSKKQIENRHFWEWNLNVRLIFSTV